MRVLLVCISVCSPFESVRYPYVVRLLLPVCFPYLSVCCPCVSVCYPMLSVVTRMLSVCIGMSPVCCPYVFRMLSVCYLYVPLCIREALVCYSVYVTSLCPCVVLVKIGCRTELTILLLFTNRETE